MTVSELIEQLKLFPPDQMVVTEGYEDGFDEIKAVKEITLKESTQKEWYLGKYMVPDTNNEVGLNAVFLYAGTKEKDKWA
jgi:hypothetical protein